MEPSTFNDLLDNFVKHRHGLDAKVPPASNAPWPTRWFNCKPTFLCSRHGSHPVLPGTGTDASGGDLSQWQNSTSSDTTTPLGAATVKQFKDNATKNGWPFVQSI